MTYKVTHKTTLTLKYSTSTLVVYETEENSLNRSTVQVTMTKRSLPSEPPPTIEVVVTVASP